MGWSEVLSSHVGKLSWGLLREQLDVVAGYSRSPQRGPGTGGDVADEFLRLACLGHRPRWGVRPGEDSDDIDRQALSGHGVAVGERSSGSHSDWAVRPGSGRGVSWQ
jgi:hypothetical protein